jgi:hypothetical protein
MYVLSTQFDIIIIHHSSFIITPYKFIKSQQTKSINEEEEHNMMILEYGDEGVC